MLRFNTTPPAAIRSVRVGGRAVSGFTLVELLTVIAIIGILGAVIGGALSVSGGSGAALSNSQRMVVGMFQAARSQALMKGTRTAVIFYGGSNTDSAKYLRFMGVVYENKRNANPADPNSPTVKEWLPLNRGAYLPKGVYYVPPVSIFSGASTLVSSSRPSADSSEPTPLRFPLAISAAPEENWYYYIFDQNGNLEGGSAYVLLVSAVVDGAPSGGELNFRPVVLEQAVGVAFRKSGGVLMIEQINTEILTGLTSSVIPPTP